MKHIAFVSFVLLLVVPSFVQARTVALDLYNPKKHYGDEGKDIVNPTSRCTGASFQNTHNASLAQAKKDRDAALAKSTYKQEIEKAYMSYDHALEMSWSAMQEPYCGFGAFGTTAALKSFNKSIADARAKFLADVKSATGTVVMALTSEPAPKIEPKTAPTLTIALDLSAVAFGQRSEKVKAFQNVLVKAGVLSADLATGYFGNMTKDALIAFQIKRGVISSKTSPGAGTIGPKTRAALLTK